jgi:hypothetical protein
MSVGIYGTVSTGDYLYVGTKSGYIGKVKADINPLVQQISKAFGYSMDVQFGDKIRTVNKKSYCKLLNSLGVTEAKVDNIYKYANFGQAVSEITLKPKQLMSEAIGKAERIKFFRKLAEAIVAGQTEKVCKYAFQGAALDITFFDRGIRDVAFNGPFDDLKPGEFCQFEVFEGTPIFHAARKGNKLAVQVLKDLGALLDGEARRYTVAMQISGGNSSSEASYSPSLLFGTLTNGASIGMTGNFKTVVGLTFVNKSMNETLYALDSESLTLVKVEKPKEAPVLPAVTLK